MKITLSPNLITIDNTGEQASYFDTDTNELHLAFYAIDTTDPMNQFATHLVKCVLTPTDVVPL